VNEHQLKIQGYLNLARRPRGRSVDSSPSVVASCCCHSGVPNGCWRGKEKRKIEGSGLNSGKIEGSGRVGAKPEESREGKSRTRKDLASRLGLA